MRRLLAAAAALLAAACGGSGGATGPTAAVPQTEGPLAAVLLQAADVPDLPDRRAFASADRTTQATPQLALCRPAMPTPSRSLGNVLFTSPTAGSVRVFELLSAYADQVTAGRELDAATAAVRGCPRFTVQGTTFTVRDIRALALAPSVRALQYRLATADVISGEVRTVAQQGRYLVLLTGYGKPAGGRSLLDYQADVMRKAVARLR